MNIKTINMNFILYTKLLITLAMAEIKLTSFCVTNHKRRYEIETLPNLYSNTRNINV